MTYRHALCLYPYLKDSSFGFGAFPPTGLEYIATALKDHVGKVSLVDLRHERKLHPIDALRRFIETDVDLICVSVSWRSRYQRVLELIRRLPADRTIIVGGREATDNVEDILEHCPNVDGVIRGEGELVVQHIADGEPWDQIEGLSFRRDGQIVHNPNARLQPIDEIPPPDRSLRRSSYYPRLHGIRLLPVQFDTVLGSRGCPYKCKFCTFSLNPFGQKRDYEARSVESVVDEIEASPARVIMFADDNFFLNAKRVERMCDLIIERGIDKRFCANARIEVSRHPHVLDKAWRAGFRMLLLGIESPTDRYLEQIDKGFTTAEVREAFNVLRQYPFFYHGYFIYGFLGQTEPEMMAISEYARELGVHALGLSRLRMDKYTPLREQVENTPGYRISSNGYVYSEAYDKKRLRRIRNRIRWNFILRDRQWLRSFSAFRKSDVVTTWQMLRTLMVLPLLGFDYVGSRLSKKVRRFRERRQRTAASPPEAPRPSAAEGAQGQ